MLQVQGYLFLQGKKANSQAHKSKQPLAKSLPMQAAQHNQCQTRESLQAHVPVWQTQTTTVKQERAKPTEARDTYKPKRTNVTPTRRTGKKLTQTWYKIEESSRGLKMLALNISVYS